MLKGLYTVIYPAPDLAKAKAWFTNLVGHAPYFDEPFYVGFNLETAVDRLFFPQAPRQH